MTSTGDNLVATLRYVTIACQNGHMPGNSPQMFHFKGIANGSGRENAISYIHLLLTLPRPAVLILL